MEFSKVICKLTSIEVLLSTGKLKCYKVNASHKLILYVNQDRYTIKFVEYHNSNWFIVTEEYLTLYIKYSSLSGKKKLVLYKVTEEIPLK